MLPSSPCLTSNIRSAGWNPAPLPHCPTSLLLHCPTAPLPNCLSGPTAAGRPKKRARRTNSGGRFVTAGGSHSGAFGGDADQRAREVSDDALGQRNRARADCRPGGPDIRKPALAAPRSRRAQRVKAARRKRDESLPACGIFFSDRFAHEDSGFRADGYFFGWPGSGLGSAPGAAFLGSRARIAYCWCVPEKPCGSGTVG